MFKLVSSGSFVKAASVLLNSKKEIGKLIQLGMTSLNTVSCRKSASPSAKYSKVYTTNPGRRMSYTIKDHDLTKIERNGTWR